MHDLLQVLLPKAAILDLRINVQRSRLCIGDPVEARLLREGEVGIFRAGLRRRFWLFGRPGLQLIGLLGPVEAAIVAPALLNGDHLRLRIVGLTPEHLARDAGPEVFISIWGDGRKLAPAPRKLALPPPESPPSPRAKTPRA